jgi:phosphatidylinositol alpha-1,6-mannosyltransferase
VLAAERYKGHDQLIDAWPRVLQSVPEAQLIVVGDGDDAARLRERAAEVGAKEGSIVFTGFVAGPALDALYERCAAFAMPSRGEGFGLVYLEAMAHRLPCIGSREDAAAEIIVDGETGVLVHHGNVEQLTGAIVRLLSERGLRERMGNAGLRRLHDRFSFERFASQMTSQLRASFEQAPRSVTGGPGAFA